jgi:hypothetical protein
MTNVAFRGIDDPPGLEIFDRVSKRRFTLYTSEVPDPKPASTEPFVFPVEEACRFVTDGIGLRDLMAVNIRDTTGTQIVTPEDEFGRQVPEGEYVLEIDGNVKTYVRVSAALDTSIRGKDVDISFGAPVEVVVGSRARIRRPPATITTTRNLDDVRRSVEALSSSLHTTSPERSYPTLRGHPPRIELGETLDVPAAVTPPETGITLVLPRTLSDLFRVAPLSYYLGARLEFGDGFRLETDQGFTADLETLGVEETLKRVFLLDCLVRSHGLYKQKTTDYEMLAQELPIELAPLYDATPADRLEAYLSVDPGLLDPHVLQWPSVAHVAPTPDNLGALPYLIDGLSLIRPGGATHYRGRAAQRVALSRFVTPKTAARGASAVFEGRETFVDLPETHARHRVWVGEGIPINASKFVTAGYEHQVHRDATERDELKVAVVCNEPEMAKEMATVESRYRPTSDQPLDLTVQQFLSVDDLAALLETDIDFFHFIGHATEAGLECPDGSLDVNSVTDVGVHSFLLNACQSYRQGRRLVEQGAVGGVVTLSDVGNDGAVEMGSTLAALLAGGFSVRDALALARQNSVVGGQYTPVGDVRSAPHRTFDGIMRTFRIESRGDTYHLWEETYFDGVWQLGSVVYAELPHGREHYLAGKERGPYEVSREELSEYLREAAEPTWVDGELYVDGDVTLDDLER